MVRKLLLPLLAVIVIMAMVIPGCTPVEPQPEEIEVTILVRTEDERKELGEYAALQLEDLGFTVNIQYGTSSELGPIWTGDPTTGAWNAYTGGWVSTVVARDEGDNFGAFYTDLWSAMGPLWVAYGHDQSFFEAAEKLWNYDFTTMAERDTLFEECLYGTMEDSVRLFMIDRTSFSAFRKGLDLAADTSGGIYGSWMWALTLHWQDGGGLPDPTNDTTVRVAMTDILTQPWNPVAGTNWVYDMFPIRATGDQGHGVDTRDGLRWPQVIEKADVVVLTGIPVGVTYEDPDPQAWVDLTFESEITVPGDAWVGWNVTTEMPITVADMIVADPGYDDTVVRMSRSYYPTGTFGIDIHDGSELSLADFLYYYILTHDRGIVGSRTYDPGYVSEYEAFVSTFGGVRYITGETGYDLIVEYYSDYWQLDAEYCVTHMFPTYTQGAGMWHTLALAVLGEEADECAFSQSKAVDPIVWTNYIGAGKEILASHLDTVKVLTEFDGEDIPYYEFIAGEYTARTELATDFDDEIIARMDNLDAWYIDHEHFWVATGPMYVDAITFVPKSIVLTRFPTYHADADKWVFLMELAPTGLGNMGAWVEEVTIEVEATPSAAIAKLQADELDIFAFGLSDAVLFQTVQDDEDLDYRMSVGSYNELTLNPVGPVTEIEGEDWVNPFALPAVRAALNKAIDRDYIQGTVMGGLGYPRYTAIGTQFGDAVRYADIITDILDIYEYDFDAADAAIETAMLLIDGVTRTDGKYYYLAP